MIFAIKQFRHYLASKPFTVVSDHRPLQWLANQKDNNSRLGRWAVLLAGYDYKIIYRPGRVHQNAAICALQDSEHSTLSKAQSKDKLCLTILNYLNHGKIDEKDKSETPIWVKEIDLFEVINGVLYRRAPPLRNKRRNEIIYQIVLPFSLKRKLMETFHDDPWSGHLAFLKNYLKVSNFYYWLEMRREIKSYCETCETCVAYCRSNSKAFLRPIELATEPFQVIGVDFLGPIRPNSPKGNSCIMAITGYFSKWLEAVALPNKTALTTVEALHSTITQEYIGGSGTSSCYGYVQILSERLDV